MSLRDKRFEVSGRDNQDKNTYEYAYWEKNVEEAVLDLKIKLEEIIEDDRVNNLIDEIFGDFEK